MQTFDSIRKLRKCEENNTAGNTTISGNSSSIGSTAMTSTETNENAGPEFRALTHADDAEQIKGFIAPLTRQLESVRLTNDFCIASELVHKGRYQC